MRSLKVGSQDAKEDEMQLLEEDIVWLNELRKKKLGVFERKLKILGIMDGEVPYREITHEQGAESRSKRAWKTHEIPHFFKKAKAFFFFAIFSRI